MGCEFPKIDYNILAVDFDGTIVSNEFPLIGVPNMVVIDKVKEFVASGGKWILYTCRNADELKAAVQFCEEQGITPDAVNDDVPDIKNSAFGRSKSIKPYFNCCVDDKNSTIETFSIADLSKDSSVLEPDELAQKRMSGIINFIK